MSKQNKYQTVNENAVAGKLESLTPVNLSGKRLLICEEGLINYSGHFYSWVKAIRDINQKAGAEVVVATNNKVLPSIREELGAIPAFSRNSWSDVYNGRGWLGRFLGLFEHNWITYHEVDKVIHDHGPFDGVLLPAVRTYHLLAWRQLLRKHGESGISRLVMFFLTSYAIYDSEYKSFKFARSSRIIQWMINLFEKDVDRKRVILAGDSHVTCAEYQRLTQLPFLVFPSPAAGLSRAGDKSSTASGTLDSKGITFVMLGVSYYEKGIDLLQTAILKHFQTNPDSQARFIVQWGIKTVDETGTHISIEGDLRNHPRVELIERMLSDDEYQTYFARADFIVLPYRRSVYFNRISGVAVEAACAGIPMIVTENTWLAWAMQEFGSGVTVCNNDSEDLFKKLQYCCDNKKLLQDAAKASQRVAEEYNSTQSYLRSQWT